MDDYYFNKYLKYKKRYLKMKGGTEPISKSICDETIWETNISIKTNIENKEYKDISLMNIKL